jgi:hypothetical protein
VLTRRFTPNPAAHADARANLVLLRRYLARAGYWERYAAASCSHAACHTHAAIAQRKRS